MGFRISWVGFEDLDRRSCLNLIGMTDTGEPDEATEAPFSMATLPTGWTILFANDFDYASDKRLAQLSGRCRVVGCQVQETVMYCRAAGYNQGKLVWSATHDSSKGLLHLETVGTLPGQFAEIERQLRAEQEENGGEDADTDYIFDIPTATTAALTGYKHDVAIFDWGEPAFTVLAGFTEGNAGQPWWKSLLGLKS